MPEALSAVPIRAHVPGTTTARVERLPETGRTAVVVRTDASNRRGALGASDGETMAEGARIAFEERLPLVVAVSSSGVDIMDGVAALHGWGRAARAVTRCSGHVPVVFIVEGLAVSGPALMLGLADLVIMTADAVAYVSGPAAADQLTRLPARS